MLIAAFAKLARDFPDWKLRILGEGSQRVSLLKQIEELGLSDQIEMPGVTDQVAEELSCSSIFVLSSRWEGLPLALIEAMSCANAIVAFDLPCVKDILSTDSAIIVPSGDVGKLADALHRMMVDETLRKACGATALAESEKFSIENIGKMWINLFEQIQ